MLALSTIIFFKTSVFYECTLVLVVKPTLYVVVVVPVNLDELGIE